MSQKILVIDDSLMLLRFTTNILNTYLPGCEVITAKRGSEGCYLAHSSRPDLILLDYVLPDMKGDDVCNRLASDSVIKGVPLIVMCGTGVDVKELQAQHPNITKLIAKPFTPELLIATVHAVFKEPAVLDSGNKQNNGGGASSNVVAASDLADAMAKTHANARVYFCADTAYFSLRSALRTIQNDELTAVLRVFYKETPVEVYFSKGRMVLATTRDADLYADGAMPLLPKIDQNVLETTLQGQKDNGTPFFVLLGLRNLLNSEEVQQMVHEFGQKLFARLWTSSRVHYECEKLSKLPECARNHRAHDEDVDHWILGTLRYIGHENLRGIMRFDPTGIPAYTREGYEAVQSLTLTATEAEFAKRVTGANNLQSISKMLGVKVDSAGVLLFRFLTLEIMEFWPASVVEAGQKAEAAPV